MKYAAEELTPTLEAEIAPLHKAHWNELKGSTSDYLQMDYPRYYQMQNIGVWRLYTARSPIGELVGYIQVIAVPSLHTQEVEAIGELYYVKPEWRGRGRTVLRLFQFVEKEMSRLGVKKLRHSYPLAAGGRYAEWFDLMGYTPQETCVVKDL